MVKHDLGNFISEGENDLNIVNKNGKRVAEIGKKDSSNKRIKTKSLYRQPTANELNRLQETENLYNSNLFRLQIEEILKEVTVKEKILIRFQEWFSHFKEFLLTIPEDDAEYDLSEKTFANKIKVKLPISKHVNTKVIFKFHKFQDVEIVGSYKLGCCINSKLVVDLQITMPAETFTKNDSINYKYHKKRAAYLAYIVSHLNKLETIETIQYTYIHNCDTKPVILIKPNGKLGRHLLIHLNLICDAEAYKLHRFCPSRNNLRESWLLTSENQEETEVNVPTPYYNSSILSDIVVNSNQEFLTSTLITSENLKQAIVLLKIWIRQRNLQVSGYIISMLIAFLVQSKRINNIMSSYQIIRNVWIALKTSEWDTKGISLNKAQETSLDDFHQHFPVVFLDKTGSYNICWQMCRGTYCALRRESLLAVEMLDNPKINSFMRLFMTPMPALTQFDHILRFKSFDKVKKSVLDKTSKSDRVNYGLDHLALVTNSLYNLLSKGLGNRVDLVLNIVELGLTWPVTTTVEKAKKNGYKESLSFGFIMNSENAMNIVDRGPPANLPEAEEFRSFWGDKSELRRFQDGAIAEACVWRADSLAERRGVARQLVDHLLHHKYDVPASRLFHASAQLEALAARGAAEERSLAALRAFDELRRELRGLERLPLDVAAVYGVSPVFSYCEPVPAPSARDPRRRARAVPAYTPAHCAVLELSHSGKWPGELAALRALKAAFHLQLAERLRRQCSLLARAQAEHVDVLKRGSVFRLRVVSAKETALEERALLGGERRPTRAADEARLRRESLLPRVRGALHGLYQKHSAFGPAVCLFKRWLSCHLLARHVPAVAAELLLAAVFLRPAPRAPPARPALAFLRALELLARTDWTHEMILLDFNDDMTAEETAAVERKFAERDVAAHHMFIATAYDGESAAPWTLPLPTRPAVLRAQAVARATLDYLERALMSDVRDDILGAFVPSLVGYDALIHLEPELVPLSSERLHAPPGPPAPLGGPEDVMPVVEFHPVERYLEELRSAYDEFALFFNDSYGGDVIAVLWKPDIHELRDLKISNAHALRPVSVDGETKYKVNIDAILEDFRILGTGLVRDVVLNTKI